MAVENYLPPNPDDQANAPVPRATFDALVKRVEALEKHRHGYRWEPVTKEGKPL